MTNPRPYTLTLTESAAAIAAGRLTAHALADDQLARIVETDGVIEAWAHLDPVHVRAAARRCDAARVAGPLAGIGIGVKDIIDTADQPTALGSPIGEDRRPARDAECVVRLARAGGYVFGKTVTTAFAFMDPGKTKNPWNLRHTPGGSSSGSAAAVAAGHVAGAIGTQTNGSVIRPAAYCGVVGFKPTFGTLPFAGIHVFSETLDQLGVHARNVADAGRLAAALAEPGTIAMDVVALPKPPRLAYLATFPWAPFDCDADDVLEAAATRLRQHDADVVAVELPSAWHEAHRILRTIMLHEAGRRLGALQDRERARMSPKLNAALDEGRTIGAADYDAALEARGRAIAELGSWLEGFDAILAPAAPAGAPAGLDTTGDPSCCTLWSLTGFPAITVPVGFDAARMPVGLQIAAPAGGDDRVLAVAAWCEARLPFKGLV